jgi:hypothetical protein
MVSNTAQHSPSRPPSTHCLYLLYFDFGKRAGGGGGGVNQREDKRPEKIRGPGNSSQSWVENTNMTDVSPVCKFY